MDFVHANFFSESPHLPPDPLLPRGIPKWFCLQRVPQRLLGYSAAIQCQKKPTSHGHDSTRRSGKMGFKSIHSIPIPSNTQLDKTNQFTPSPAQQKKQQNNSLRQHPLPKPLNPLNPPKPPKTAKTPQNPQNPPKPPKPPKTPKTPQNPQHPPKPPKPPKTLKTFQNPQNPQNPPKPSKPSKTPKTPKTPQNQTPPPPPPRLRAGAEGQVPRGPAAHGDRRLELRGHADHGLPLDSKNSGPGGGGGGGWVGGWDRCFLKELSGFPWRPVRQGKVLWQA